MDSKKFEREKSRIIKGYAKYPFLVQIKATLDTLAQSAEVREYGEAKFEYNDQDEACKELGWPDDHAHHDQVIIIIGDFLKYKLGWEWDIRNIVKDAEPKWHSGYVTLIKCGKEKSGTHQRSKSKGLKKIFGKKKKSKGSHDDAEEEEESDEDDKYFKLGAGTL